MTILARQQTNSNTGLKASLDYQDGKFILTTGETPIEVHASKLVSESYKYPSDIYNFFKKLSKEVPFDKSLEAEDAIKAVCESNCILF